MILPLVHAAGSSRMVSYGRHLDKSLCSPHDTNEELACRLLELRPRFKFTLFHFRTFIKELTPFCLHSCTYEMGTKWYILPPSTNAWHLVQFCQCQPLSMGSHPHAPLGFNHSSHPAVPLGHAWSLCQAIMFLLSSLPARRPTLGQHIPMCSNCITGL